MFSRGRSDTSKHERARQKARRQTATSGRGDLLQGGSSKRKEAELWGRGFEDSRIPSLQRPQTELISRQSAEGPDKEIKMDAPKSFTMERLGDTKQVVVAQSTSQMCRTGCCQVR